MLRIKIVALFFISFGLFGQTENIELVSYNLMYYKTSSAPCTHSRTSTQRDNDLKNIISYLAPDIFVAQELGTAAVNPLVMMADILNVNGVTHFQRAASSNNSSSSLVNMLFYNKDKLVLMGQDKIEFDLNNVPLIRVIDFYHLYVKDQGLGTPGVDTVFLSIGVAHLKAGNSSSDATQRGRATAAVMDYIEDLNHDNVLFAGDFNVYNSNESAFQNLVNYSPNPSISLNDPINQLGSWNNNSNFSTVHTQSTHSSSNGCFSGGGMDDRFDFILCSDAIINNSAHLNYVSYRTVGQDGGSYNNSLSTNNNTDVPSSIASALYNFSDHLPVSMELEAKVSGIGISENEIKRGAWSFSNPSMNELNIYFKDILRKDKSAIEIMDLQGRTVYRQNLNGETELHVSCNEWTKGLYLIRLSQAQWSETRKVVVQ